MTYRELLEHAKLNPRTADFTELRYSLTRSEEYAPGTADEGTLTELTRAVDDGETEIALNLANRMLEVNYLDIHAHLAAGWAYHARQDENNMRHHRAFATALVDSICRSGDGRTFESALSVIDMNEKYAVLSVCGLKLLSERSSLHRGHQYDVIQVRDEQTGRRFDLYFDVDLPKCWLEQAAKSEIE